MTPYESIEAESKRLAAILVERARTTRHVPEIDGAMQKAIADAAKAAESGSAGKMAAAVEVLRRFQ